MSTDSVCALETVGLGKSFGSLVVTNTVNLRIPVGARYALIGPNGAGKTTLVNLLTGQLPPDRGKVILNGQEITHAPIADRVKRGLSRTFQINSAFPNLTPLESVVMTVSERNGKLRNFWQPLDKQEAKIAEAEDLLARLRLIDVANKRTASLAYGQRRLLEIALALATKPSVLLLDEPAAGVPREESGELFSVLEQLPSDLSILFIEHDMDLVFRFASQIVVLVLGAVLTQGSAAEIARDPKVKEVYLGNALHG